MSFEDEHGFGSKKGLKGAIAKRLFGKKKKGKKPVKATGKKFFDIDSEDRED